MARPPRTQIPGGIYHVWDHGVDDVPIYRDADDRARFQGVLADVLDRFGWTCLAYCQMTTHYHVLVRTLRADIGNGMKRLNGCYAQGYNRRHGRRGHLFESRYGGRLVETDAYLATVFAYLAMNPVDAGICDDPLGWPWSSCRQTLLDGGRGDVPTTELLRYFGRDPREAAARLQRFLRGAIRDPRVTDV
jgi:putative transposase